MHVHLAKRCVTGSTSTELMFSAQILCMFIVFKCMFICITGFFLVPMRSTGSTNLKELLIMIVQCALLKCYTIL